VWHESVLATISTIQQNPVRAIERTIPRFSQLSDAVADRRVEDASVVFGARGALLAVRVVLRGAFRCAGLGCSHRTVALLLALLTRATMFVRARCATLAERVVERRAVAIDFALRRPAAIFFATDEAFALVEGALAPPFASTRLLAVGGRLENALSVARGAFPRLETPRRGCTVGVLAGGALARDCAALAVFGARLELRAVGVAPNPATASDGHAHRVCLAVRRRRAIIVAGGALAVHRRALLELRAAAVLFAVCTRCRVTGAVLACGAPAGEEALRRLRAALDVRGRRTFASDEQDREHRDTWVHPRTLRESAADVI